MKSKYLMITMAAIVALVGSVEAASRVKGYQKKNGTYVQPHQRSRPNNSKIDNWSSKGNYNPYTGQKGTKDSLYQQPK